MSNELSEKLYTECITDLEEDIRRAVNRELRKLYQYRTYHNANCDEQVDDVIEEVIEIAVVETWEACFHSLFELLKEMNTDVDEVQMEKISKDKVLYDAIFLPSEEVQAVRTYLDL